MVKGAEGMTKSKGRFSISPARVLNSILIVAIVSAGYWGWAALHPKVPIAPLQTATVSVGDVTSTVSASGKVISPGDIGVSSTVNALITSIPVKVGQHVRAGQTLAKLDSSAQSLSLVQAKNALLSAKVSLTKLTPTRTVAEQAQADLQLTNAQNSVDIAQTSLDDQMNLNSSNALAYQTTVDNAKKALDDATALATINIGVYQTTVDSAKAALASMQITRDNYFNTWSPYGYNVSYCSSLSMYGINSTTVSDTFSKCSSILGNETSLANAQTTYNSALVTQKSNLLKDAQNLANLTNSYQSSLATQAASLKKDAITLQNSWNSLDSAQSALATLKATQAVSMQSSKDVDLEIAQGAVAVAQANVEQAQKNLDGTVIKSPVTGDIASISAGVGMSAPTQATNNSTTVSGFFVITNVTALEVTASFSEADAAKLAVGQGASFTFDALPSMTATGQVISIDLLPTSNGSVTSYSAIFGFDAPVDGLKPGMTATATVVTGVAMGVTQVSAQAVTTRGTRESVNIVTIVKGKQVLTPTRVVVGLKGDSTDEIQSGVKEGDVVALPSVRISTASNGFAVGGVPSGLGGLSGAGGGARGGAGFAPGNG